MKFTKSSPELCERFEAALPAHPDVEPKQMFGYPASWVNGNFFAGLFAESVVIRLPGALLSAVPDMKGAEPFNPMGTGKGMSGWYVVPERYSRDVGPLAVLLERALGPVRAQPPKEKKPKKPAAKKPAAKKPAAKKPAAKKPASRR